MDIKKLQLSAKGMKLTGEIICDLILKGETDAAMVMVNTSDEYSRDIKKILNERNSVDEVTKSFACCPDCEEIGECYSRKKCYLKGEFGK